MRGTFDALEDFDWGWDDGEAEGMEKELRVEMDDSAAGNWGCDTTVRGKASRLAHVIYSQNERVVLKSH